MSERPADFESGYIFESQKRIQDRRNALGLDQEPTRSTTGADGASGEGGHGHWIASLLIGILWIIWKVLAVVIPPLLSLAWEAAKLVGSTIAAILFNSRR